MIQLLLAFAYYDASLLQAYSKDFPAFRDDFDFSMFYAHSWATRGIPRVNCTCTILAIILLCFVSAWDSTSRVLTLARVA